MSNHATKLATAAAVICLALPAFGQDTQGEGADPDTVVATVNGEEITLGHVAITRASLPDQYSELPDDVLFQGILDQIVQQTLLAQDAEGQLSDRARMALENERRLLLAGEAVDDVISDSVSDTAVQQVYDARYEDAGAGKEYNASHILTETEQEAQALVQDLRDGADFAELAQQHSTGPSSENGGDLGWFGEGAMVGPFNDAVVEMQPGEISDPVQTQFGWHVIRLDDTREKEAPALDEVRAEIEEEVRQAAVEARLETLSEEASIDIDDSIDPALMRDPGLWGN